MANPSRRSSRVLLPSDEPTGLVVPRSLSDLILPATQPTPIHYIPGYPRAADRQLATVQQNNWVPGRDGAPLVMYDTGLTADGERAASILFDRPEDYRFRRPKQTVEEHHFERFLADWRRGIENLPLEYRRGADPPDFEVQVEGQRVGVDLTHLVLEEQVAKHALFRDNIKSAILQEGPAAFRQLRGLIVYLSLNEDAERRMRAAAPACIEALRSLDPVPPRMRNDPQADLPYVFFDEGSATTGVLRRPAAGAFFGLMGFEVALTGGPLVRYDEAVGMVQRLVTQHDKPGVDILNVAIMAPVAAGFVFASDGVPMHLIVERAEELRLDAEHLRSVYFHTWLNRSIYVVYTRHKGLYELAEGEDPFPVAVRTLRYFGDPGDAPQEGESSPD
jgi:hypothetical protein